MQFSNRNRFNCDRTDRIFCILFSTLSISSHTKFTLVRCNCPEVQKWRQKFYVGIRAVSLKTTDLSFHIEIHMHIFSFMHIENHDGNRFGKSESYDWVPAEELKIVFLVLPTRSSYFFLDILKILYIRYYIYNYIIYYISYIYILYI